MQWKVFAILCLALAYCVNCEVYYEETFKDGKLIDITNEIIFKKNLIGTKN